MIDSVECRSTSLHQSQQHPHHPHHHHLQGISSHHHHSSSNRSMHNDQPVSYVVGQNNGIDMSTGGFAVGCNNGGGNSYTTLTPLKPLPPISSVSERLGTSGANGFVYMQNCNNTLGHNGAGGHDYSPLPYKYQEMDDEEMHMSGSCNGYDLSVEPVAVSAASQMNSSTSYSHVVTPQYAMYGQAPTAGNCSSQIRKSEGMNVGGSMATAAYNDTLNYQSNHMSQTKLEQRELGCSMSMESLQAVHGGISPHGGGLMVPLRHNQMMIDRNHQVSLGHHRVGSPDQPSSSTDLHECNMKQMRPPVDISNGNGNGGGGSGGAMEEISTRDVAQRVSNELKRYSIPQAVFAQRVLGRSQGTLSDLLRNPKPWSKLKSGRETFRRMWKWLQEPEYQRMAALRSVATSSASYNTATSDAVAAAAAAAAATAAAAAANTATPSTSRHPHQQQQQPLSVQTGFKRGRDGVTIGCPESTAQPASCSSSISSSPSASTAPAGPMCAQAQPPQMLPPKKPRMVFTEIQRRTLVAIFREIKRPSKEIQATIAEQLGLKVSTVVNFFMNARRRSVDKYLDETPSSSTGADRDLSTVSSTANHLDETTALTQ